MLDDVLSAIDKGLVEGAVKHRPLHKQRYRNKQGDGWLISNLVAAAQAANLPVQSMLLSELADKQWKAFDGKSRNDVARHVQLILAADLSYPILLSAEGHVMDGNHRIVKAILLGRENISYQQFEVNPPPTEEQPKMQTDQIQMT